MCSQAGRQFSERKALNHVTEVFTGALRSWRDAREVQNQHQSTYVVHALRSADDKLSMPFDPANAEYTKLWRTIGVQEAIL